MPVDMRELADDLAAETAALRAMVAGLDDDGWRKPTPAEGWRVGDQISHLAFFDDAAIQSATDPEGFAAEMERAVTVGELVGDRRVVPVGARFAVVRGKKRQAPPPVCIG